MEECSGVRVARDFERSTLFPIDLCIAYKCNRSWKEQHPKRVNELHIESGATLQDEYYYLDEWNVRECVWARERESLQRKFFIHLCLSYPLHSCFRSLLEPSTLAVSMVHECVCAEFEMRTLTYNLKQLQ